MSKQDPMLKVATQNIYRSSSFHYSQMEEEFMELFSTAWARESHIEESGNCEDENAISNNNNDENFQLNARKSRFGTSTKKRGHPIKNKTSASELNEEINVGFEKVGG